MGPGFKKKWLLLSIGILVVGAAWIWLTKAPPGSAAQSRLSVPQVGFPAPDFQLQTLDGETVTLSDLRGRAVVINLWASWCPPCRSEMPAIESVYQQYQDRELAVLAVNATNQDDLRAAEEFVVQNGLSFPILLDTDGTVSRRYELRSLPTTFFIDPGGTIQDIVIGGPMSAASLQMRIEALLEIEEVP